jgi:hypothetical protein
MTIFFKFISFLFNLFLFTVGLSYLNFFLYAYISGYMGYIFPIFLILPLTACQANIIIEYIKRLDRKLGL